MTSTSLSWIKINQNHFLLNIAAHKKLAGPNVTLSVVIKANAYGHGLQPIAQICQSSSLVDWLCVVKLSEALELRAARITKPILVLSFIDDDIYKAIKQNISLVVFDLKILHKISRAAQQLQKQAFVHLKVNTGLNRLGFSPEEIMQNLTILFSTPRITIQGICTHFAEPNNPDKTFTMKQRTIFEQLLHTLSTQKLSVPFVHAANSPALHQHSNISYNFVRVGAGAYGLLPPADMQIKLQQVLTWKTKIISLRTIQKGDSIGYNRTHIASQTQKIAILPVGYADGYDRKLSNKAVVLIQKNGKNYYAPVVGVICMNHTMVDVTNVPNVCIGDEVILTGDYPAIRAYDLAILTESYNARQITTNANSHIERILCGKIEKKP